MGMEMEMESGGQLKRVEGVLFLVQSRSFSFLFLLEGRIWWIVGMGGQGICTEVGRVVLYWRGGEI